MPSAFDILRERGFVQQCTDEAAVRTLLDTTKIVYYAGFDPTADSLHAGSLVPIMAMAHLKRAGHRPIAVIGGGTTMVGDPSGKTEMRQLLSPAQIDANGVHILEQLRRYLDLGSPLQGLFLNNAEWLLPLKYVDFLRDIGRHFRVNEMLRAEAYRARLEREEGLSFIEFNYQLLQAYDFLRLFQQHGCVLQIGGDDQWSNILAGIDLIRKFEAKTAHALTFPLLTTARGEKMGKTAGGAVWLSAARTSPYDFYQYWINTDDRDVERFLLFFTLLPVEEVGRLSQLQGADIRQAKEVLAFEATRLCHGDTAAQEARTTSEEAFGKNKHNVGALPTTFVEKAALQQGIPLVDLLIHAGGADSKNAARRLIQQGGAYVNDKQVTDVAAVIRESDFAEGQLLLRHGKKHYKRIICQ